MSDSLWPHGLHPPGSSVYGMFQARILECGYPFSRNLPDPGIEPSLLYCRQILYCLSHKGSPRILEWVAYPFSSRSSQPRNWTRVSCIAGGFFTNWAMREDLIVKLKLGNTYICKKHLHLEHRIFSTWPSKKVNRYITKKIHTYSTENSTLCSVVA